MVAGCVGFGEDKRQSEGVGGLGAPNGLSHAIFSMAVPRSSSKSFFFVVLYSR